MEGKTIIKRVQLSGKTNQHSRLGISKMSKDQHISKMAKQLDDIIDDDQSLITEELSAMSAEEDDIKPQKS
jgi:hypothetical protein